MSTTEPTTAQFAPPTMQELYLEVLRRSRCNALDGQRVYDALMANRDIWESAYPVRQAGGDDITLRDLADDSHDVDTVLLRTAKDKAPLLEALASHWGADEIDVTFEKWGVQPKAIIRVWWD